MRGTRVRAALIQADGSSVSYRLHATSSTQLRERPAASLKRSKDVAVNRSLRSDNAIHICPCSRGGFRPDVR